MQCLEVSHAVRHIYKSLDAKGLTLTLDGGGCSTPRPGHFTPGKKSGWAPGPVWKVAENLAPYRDSIPGPSRP